MSTPQFSELITFLHTRDLEQITCFYQVNLGLELVLDQGKCRIFRVSKHSYIGFCSHLSNEVQPNSLILTLVTDKVDEIFAMLIEQKVPIDNPPQTNHEFGIYHFFLRDPDGHLVEIQQFLDSEWMNSQAISAGT
jgi:catechol 2,3-dioxygenase-like lactoylglutathione lyase family enzyme